MDFIAAINATIAENGNITEAAKGYFENIPLPEIEKPADISNKVIRYYNENVQQTGVLRNDYIDEDAFISEVKEEIGRRIRELSDDYSEEYRSTLRSLIGKIKVNYTSRLNEYSVAMGEPLRV